MEMHESESDSFDEAADSSILSVEDDVETPEEAAKTQEARINETIQDKDAFVEKLKEFKVLSQEMEALQNDLNKAKRKNDKKEISRIKQKIFKKNDELLDVYNDVELQLEKVKDELQTTNKPIIRHMIREMEKILPPKPAQLNVSRDYYDPIVDEDVEETSDQDYAEDLSKADYKQVLEELPALTEMYQKISRLIAALMKAHGEGKQKRMDVLNSSIASKIEEYNDKYDELQRIKNRIMGDLGRFNEEKALEMIEELEQKFPPSLEENITENERADTSLDEGTLISSGSKDDALTDIEGLHKDYQEELEELQNLLKIKKNLENAAKSRQNPQETELTHKKLEDVLQIIHLKVPELQELKQRFWDKYGNLDANSKRHVEDMNLDENFRAEFPQISPRRDVNSYFPRVADDDTESANEIVTDAQQRRRGLKMPTNYKSGSQIPARPQSQAGPSRTTGLPQPSTRPQSQASAMRPTSGLPQPSTRLTQKSQLPSTSLRPPSAIQQPSRPQPNLTRQSYQVPKNMAQSGAQPSTSKQTTYKYFNMGLPPSAQIHFKPPSTNIQQPSTSRFGFAQQTRPTSAQPDLRKEVLKSQMAKRPATSQNVSSKIHQPAPKSESRHPAGVSVPHPMFENLPFNQNGLDYEQLRGIVEPFIISEGTIGEYMARMANYEDRNFEAYTAMESFRNGVTEGDDYFEDYEKAGTQVAKKLELLMKCICGIFEGFRYILKVYRGDNFDFRENEKREIEKGIRRLCKKIQEDNFPNDYRDRVRTFLRNWILKIYSILQGGVESRSPKPKARAESTSKLPQKKGPTKQVSKFAIPKPKVPTTTTANIVATKAKIQKKLNALPSKPLTDVINDAKPTIKVFLEAFCKVYNDSKANLKKARTDKAWKGCFDNARRELLEKMNNCYSMLPYNDLKNLKAPARLLAFEAFLNAVYEESKGQDFSKRMCLEKLEPLFIEWIIKKQMKNQVDLLRVCAESTNEMANLAAAEPPKSSLRKSSKAEPSRVSFHGAGAPAFSPIREDPEDEEHERPSFHAPVQLNRVEYNKLRAIFKPLSDDDYEIDHLTEMIANEQARDAIKILMEHFEMIKESTYKLLLNPRSENRLMALRSDLEDYRDQLNQLFFTDSNRESPADININGILRAALIFHDLDEISQLGLSQQEIQEFVNNPHDDLRQRIKNCETKIIIFDFIREMWAMQREYFKNAMEGNFYEDQELFLISRRSECKSQAPKRNSVEPVIVDSFQAYIPTDIIEKDILHVACEVLSRNEEIEVAGRSSLEKFIVAIAERFREGKMSESRALMAIKSIVNDMPCIPVEFYEKYIYSEGNPYFAEIYVGDPQFNVSKRLKILKGRRVQKCGRDESEKEKENVEVDAFMQRMGQRHTNPDEFFDSLDEVPEYVTYIPMLGAEVSMDGSAVLGIPAELDSTQLTAGNMDNTYMLDSTVLFKYSKEKEEELKSKMDPATLELLARTDAILNEGSALPRGPQDPIIFKLYPKAGKRKTFWQARGNSIPAWYPGTFLMMPDQKLPLKYSQPFDHLLANAWNLMSPLKSKTRVRV